MNFLGFCVIVILTYLISVTGLCQIIGTIKFNLLKKPNHNYFFTLFIWFGILIGYGYIIFNFYHKYFYIYLVTTIISFILSLGVKDE